MSDLAAGPVEVVTQMLARGLTAMTGGRLRLLQVTHWPGQSTSLVAFDEAGREVSVPSAVVHMAMSGINTATRSATDTRPLTAELTMDDRGGYELRYSFELVSLSPARAILDHSH